MKSDTLLAIELGVCLITTKSQLPPVEESKP